MRLSPDEHRIIRRITAAQFGESARLILFGSRVDDAKRGGDIDLLVDGIPAFRSLESLEETRISTLTQLQFALGDQRIDLVLSPDAARDSRPVVQHAQATGVLL